ncbi:MAG: DNA polymerase/3'-5' exonuclease PolX [Verrucomicrobia bacterium]|nr:DNA polymerase/3'-5' exonuclease PolX [Verrucomicrobiota bacterium]
MNNDRIAEILEEIGTLLELKGENPFKTRAYTNAANTVRGTAEPFEKLVAEDRLQGIKGIGESIRSKITELVGTGRLEYYEELKNSIPAGLIALTQLPTLGPKKVKILNEKLGVTNIDQLEDACRQGKIAQIEGFGPKSEAKILEGIRFHRQYATKHLLIDAILISDHVLVQLRNHPDVIRCDVAGSVRRHKEVIGDMDFLVSSKRPSRVIDFFTNDKRVINVIAKGETRASVNYEGGIQADLRVVDDQQFPFALAYFTGSKQHNIIMRRLAIQHGWLLNEYGLFDQDEETRDAGNLIPCKNEEDIFNRLGLSYISPELREDQGEFEAAEKDNIPRLLEWTQLRGSLHNHSNWSDGFESLDTIASGAADLGLDYWAVTDHSRSSRQANGISAETLRKQIIEIKDINAKLAEQGADFSLLSGIEVDVLADGRLDFDDDLLSELDIVIASIHSAFAQPEAETTQRLIKAAQNPFVHMIGHPTGRLLLEREPYRIDIKALIDACAETGTWIELNAHPQRLDLDWRHWRHAKDKGVKCAVNCDAHRLAHAAFLRLGAGIARKGWLTPDDVVNTLKPKDFMNALSSKRRRYKVI